jgi:hypothetical protein
VDTDAVNRDSREFGRPCLAGREADYAHYRYAVYDNARALLSATTQMAGRGFDLDVWRRLKKALFRKRLISGVIDKPINDCFGSPIVSGRCYVLNFPVPAGTPATSARHPLRASGP